MATAGDRVMAISHTKDGKAFVFGCGVYEGDHKPEDHVLVLGVPFGESKADVPAFYERYRNPRIKLDSGKVVYGCECWWGPEDKVRARIAGLERVDVDIDEARRG